MAVRPKHRHIKSLPIQQRFHIHIVPRWDGDTNFMNVCSDTNVVSQSLTELLKQLKQISKEHDLPSL